MTNTLYPQLMRIVQSYCSLSHSEFGANISSRAYLFTGTEYKFVLVTLLIVKTQKIIWFKRKIKHITDCREPHFESSTLFSGSWFVTNSKKRSENISILVFLRVNQREFSLIEKVLIWREKVLLIHKEKSMRMSSAW